MTTALTLVDDSYASSAPAAAASAPLLRVVPAPPSAPPYDDELTGFAPLHLVLDPAPHLEPPAYDDSHWLTEDRTPTSELPCAETASRVLVQGLIEVFAGVRPLRLFRMQLSMDLYAHLAARLENGRRTPGGRPEPRTILALHTQEWPEGIVEVCATVRRQGTFSAMALRLEGFSGRWVCTDLEGL